LKHAYNVLYYLILSISAAFMLLLIAYIDYSDTNTIHNYSQEIVVGFFILSCILGISLAIRPRWYKKIIKRKDNNKIIKQTQKIRRKRKGHHPDCNQFKNHVVKIKNKSFCSGCLGLALGSAISIILIILYYTLTLQQRSTTFYLFIYLGLIIICFSYIEIMILKRNVIVHIISNILLVVSFFLITISVFELTKNLVIGMISILLSYLWLTTRVQISISRHILICNNCSKTCKMY